MQTCHTLSTVYQIYAFVGHEFVGHTPVAGFFVSRHLGLLLCNIANMAKITKEWIVIGNYDGSILAEMAKGILTENDIPCYIKGDFFSTAYNINALSMPGGSVKLYIPKAFKTKAEELIKDIIPSNE